MKTYPNLIVALDYENIDTAYGLIETLGERVSTYKIGPILFTRSGSEIVRFLHTKRKKVFLDLKLYDTPNVVADTIRQLGELGAAYATVHCLGGRTMLEAAGSACRGTELKLIGVTLLTSQGAQDSMNWGWPQTELQMVQKLTDLAMECRLSGVMCSAHELESIRPNTPPGFLLMTPGVRNPEVEVYQDDQKRTATAQKAMELGADYLIVGRPITQSREPLQALEKIMSQPK